MLLATTAPKMNSVLKAVREHVLGVLFLALDHCDCLLSVDNMFQLVNLAVRVFHENKFREKTGRSTSLPHTSS